MKSCHDYCTLTDVRLCLFAVTMCFLLLGVSSCTALILTCIAAGAREGYRGPLLGRFSRYGVHCFVGGACEALLSDVVGVDPLIAGFFSSTRISDKSQTLNSFCVLFFFFFFYSCPKVDSAPCVDQESRSSLNAQYVWGAGLHSNAFL